LEPRRKQPGGSNPGGSNDRRQQSPRSQQGRPPSRHRQGSNRQARHPQSQQPPRPSTKQSKASKAVKPVPTVPSLRILKVGRCPTVSGKSTLTYHVGCTAESAIQIRLYANSGNGFLNQDWIPWTAIQERLKPQSGESTFTSQVLHALFRGKSLNSPGFLMAVLKAEGVVKPSAVKRRCYEATKDARFLAEIERLMASAVDLAVDEAETGGDIQAEEAGCRYSDRSGDRGCDRRRQKKRYR
jgi:hypothetical protein